MDKEELKILVDKGLSTYKIAEELNCSQTNIRHWLKKYSLKTKIRRGSNVEDFITCSSCWEIKCKDEYYANGKSLHTHCKTCVKKKVIERQREIKKKVVQYMGGKCIDCGYDKHLAALQIHHLNPSIKDPNFTQFKTRKFDVRFEKELKSCVLLCANCHAVRHAAF